MAYRFRIGGPGLLSAIFKFANRSGSRGTALRFSSRSSYTSGGLDQGLWEEAYTDVIDKQVEKAGNTGQETLLGEDYFAGEAKEYCRIQGDDYTPDGFVSFIKNSLGDDYYNAISEIIEECSQELFEAWDYSFSNDGIGQNLFGPYRHATYFTSQFSRYGNFSNAKSIYSARATARLGKNFNTTAASVARSRAFATKFLAQNPTGLSRTTRSTPYAGRSASEAANISRQTAARFLKNNPNGRARVYYP